MTKVCPKCSQPNLPEAVFCASCASPLSPATSTGAPPYQQQQWNAQGGPVIGQPQQPSSGAGTKAIIALCLAAAALFCCGPFAGIPAAIVGWMELNSINAGQSPPSGKWMAMVGLWGGIASTVLHIVIYVVYLLFAMLAASNPYNY